MSHKLIKKGVSLSDQASLCSTKYFGHSHKCLIEETCKRLKFDKCRDEQDYRNGVKQLKEKRESSDYKEERISQEASEACIKLAKEIRQKLNSI